jgi:hypothetical protein
MMNQEKISVLYSSKYGIMVVGCISQYSAFLFNLIVLKPNIMTECLELLLSWAKVLAQELAILTFLMVFLGSSRQIAG